MVPKCIQRAVHMHIQFTTRAWYTFYMKLFAGIVVGLLLPAVAFGATFAKETLFLSKNTVAEGDTTLVHAIVSNDANAKFTGKLEIKDEDTLVGSVPVSLAIGEASVVSVSWKPTAGSHTLVATLRNSTGAVAAKESATFSIKEKPGPLDAFVSSSTPGSSVSSSAEIQKAIANISPAVAKGSAPVFSTIDSLRENAAKVLESGSDWSKKQIGASAIKNQGAILGTETEKPASSKITSSLWTMLATLLLYVFSLLLYVVSTPGVFYPLLAALFIFILWKCWRRYRRRR